VNVIVYPDVYLIGEPLYIGVRNATNTTTSFTLKIYDGSTLLATLVSDPVPPTETLGILIPYEYLADLFAGRANKFICLTCEAPTESVVLLGGPTAPNFQGAVQIYVSSSVTVTVTDYRGNPIPYAHVDLCNVNTRQRYTYYADANGVARLPSYAGYGQWIIEVYKKDYATGNVHYYVGTFDFTSKTISCYYGSRFIVTVALEPRAGWLEDVGKAITDWLPEPLKTVAKWIGNSVGWASKQAQNFIWNFYLKKQLEQTDYRITSVYYDPDANKIYVSYAVSDLPPLVALAIIALIAILGVTVGWVTVNYFSVKVEEERTKQTEILKDIQNQITQARESGAISEDTYRQLMSEFFNSLSNWQKSATGPSLMDVLVYAIPAIIAVSVMILMVSIIRAVRE